MNKRKQAALERKIARWNKEFPVGTEVVFWHGKGESGECFNGVRTTVRHEAFAACSGHPVAFVDGVSGYVDIDFVEARGSRDFSEGDFLETFEHRWSEEMGG